MKKIILSVLSASAGFIIGGSSMGYLSQKTVKEKSDKVLKFKKYYNMLNEWLILKQKGKSLNTYFIDKEYKQIAIYGMGEMGNRLYDELKNSDISIKYAIDKEPETVYSDLNVLGLEDELPNVDIIVVTSIFAYDEIEELLLKKVDCDIVSLEDLIFEC